MSLPFRKKTTLRERALAAGSGAASSTLSTVSTKVAPAVDAAAPKVAAAKEWAAPRVVAAKDAAAPKVVAAKEWAAPRVESAVERTREVAAPAIETAVDKAREDILPKVSAAVAAALAASEPVREEAKDRSVAAVLAIKGDLKPAKPKGRRFGKRFLLLFVVVGGAYAGWRAWLAKNSDPWADSAAYSSATITPDATETPSVDPETWTSVDDAPVDADVAVTADPTDESVITDGGPASAADLAEQTEIIGAVPEDERRGE